jgi:uncharacterized protein YdaU (DUF1376 family)
MHYYQFNIGDYKSHTEHLSDLEDLAYRRMLDWYYLHETPLPLETSEIARLIRMRTHTDCIAVVLQEFFIRNENGWTNHRADQEIARAGEKSSKASESAKARWSKHKDADAMRTHSESNATQDTRHITQDPEHKKTKTQRGTRLPTGFELPDEWIEFCRQERADLDPQTVFAEFLDYWIAQPGQKGVKTDWPATWRNWVRRQTATRSAQGRNEHKHAAASRAIFDGVFDNE